MSPKAAILQGLFVGLMLTAVRAFGWTYEAAGLLIGALSLVALPWWMGRGPRRGLAGNPCPEAMESGERIKIGISLLLLAVPSLILIPIHGATGFIDVTGSDNQNVVLAMLVIAAVAGYLVYFSTLMDWFCVRPYLSGGAGTICATSLDEQWRGITRTWLLHRSLAMLGVIAAITALVALAANSWIRPIDEIVAGVIAGVATIIAGYYLTRAAPLLAIAVNPPVQVGDVIEIAEEFNVYKPDDLREYFVVDVALEGVKLLQVHKGDTVPRRGPDAKRTHDRTVDVMEISKLLRGRRATKPCRGRCQRFSEHCACDSAWMPPTDGASAAGATEAA